MWRFILELSIIPPVHLIALDGILLLSSKHSFIILESLWLQQTPPALQIFLSKLCLFLQECSEKPITGSHTDPPPHVVDRWGVWRRGRGPKASLQAGPIGVSRQGLGASSPTNRASVGRWRGRGVRQGGSRLVLISI